MKRSYITPRYYLNVGSSDPEVYSGSSSQSSLFTELIDGIPVSMIKRTRTKDAVELYVVDLKLTDTGFAGVEDTDYEMIYETPLLTPVQAEYLTVKAAMTTQPSDADAVIQNKWVYDLLPVWDKLILADNFACPDEQASLLNWKSPGTCNPTLIYAPAFTAYKGFLSKNTGGATDALIKTNFVPSVNGAGFLGQDDITIIIGLSDDVLTDTQHDLYGGGTGQISFYSVNQNYAFIELNSSGSNYVQNITHTSKTYLSAARINGAIVDVYKNLQRRSIALASTGLCDQNLWFGGKDQWHATNKTNTFLLIFKYLTEIEVQGVVKTCERYLKNYGTNIIEYQTSVEFNLVSEGHSFMVVNSWIPCYLSEKVNTLTHNVLGIGGNSIAQMAARSATVDALLVNETATLKNILAVFCGVNDVVHTAGEGATAYAALKAYIQARAAAGWKVFVFTMTASDNTDRTGAYHAQWEIQRGVFNNSLRTDLSLAANVYIMDTDTIAELSEGTADYANCYNADKLHLTNQGALLASGLFETKMIELYG